MTHTKTLLTSFSLLFVLVGCWEAERASPDQTYRAYYATVAEGRSFDEDAAFHSKSRQEEISQMISARQEQSGQSADAIKNLYLSFTQKLASCGSLTLSEERIDGDVAHLVYVVESTCADSPGGQLLIEMTYEDGWKVLSDELKVTAN